MLRLILVILTVFIAQAVFSDSAYADENLSKYCVSKDGAMDGVACADSMFENNCYEEVTFFDKIICRDHVFSRVDVAISMKIFEKLSYQGSTIRAERERLYRPILSACLVPVTTETPTREQVWSMAPCIAKELSNLLAALGGTVELEETTPLPEGVIHPICVLSASGDVAGIGEVDGQPTPLNICQAGVRHLPVSVSSDGWIHSRARYRGYFDYRIVSKVADGRSFVQVLQGYEGAGRFSGLFLISVSSNGGVDYINIDPININRGDQCYGSIKDVVTEGGEIFIDYYSVPAQFSELIKIEKFGSLDEMCPSCCFGVTRVKYNLNSNKSDVVGFLIDSEGYYFKDDKYDEEGEKTCIARILKKEGLDRFIPVERFPAFRREILRRCRPDR